MSYTTENQPLTSNDIHTIQRINKKQSRGYLITSAIFLVLLLLTYKRVELGLTVFLLTFCLAFLAFAVVILSRMQTAINKGFKQVINGCISSKYEKTSKITLKKSKTFYYFKFDDIDIEVPFFIYNQYNNNQFITIERTASGEVFSTSSINAQNRTEGSLQHSDYELQNLNEEEIKLLNKKRQKRVIWTFVISFLAYLTLLNTCNILINKYFNLLKNLFALNIQADELYNTANVTLIIIAIIIAYKILSPIFKDIRNNKKRIIATTVSDKIKSDIKRISQYVSESSPSGNYHYLIVNGHYFEVTSDLYHSVETGEKIALKITPNAKIFLGLEKAR